MNIVGIIATKTDSGRFPGKNYHIVDGRPMFAHGLELLDGCPFIGDVYVSADTGPISDYCYANKIKFIQRGPNVIHNDAPLLTVLKYVYQSLYKKYDIIASILANTVGHTQRDYNAAVKLMIDNPEINEVRSFDASGNETGILIFRERVILEAPAISSHLGAVTTSGREIHYEHEL